MMPSNGITLGRVFRIRIALDVSVIFIALLLTFSLGAGVFPSWHPAWAPSLSWALAASATSLFLLSILAHELAHALVARAYGIPVSSITLFIFGGVASIERNPDSPSSEALIAIVGPATSMGIGVACLAAAGILAPAWATDPEAMLTAAGPVATLMMWLGPVNILLAVFNMLPGLPLDGGRVLRAFLWRTSGDLERATRGASFAGQALGWLLIGAGGSMALGISVPLLGGGLLPGLWTALIGLFLKSAAAESHKDVLLRRALGDVTVARLMRGDLPRINGRESVTTLVEEGFLRRGARLVSVEHDGQLSGIVDARRVRDIPRSSWDHTSVDTLVRPLSEFPHARPADGVYPTLQRMLRERIDPLLVCEDGRIAGVVSVADVDRWLELQNGQGPRPRRVRWTADEPQ